MSSADTSVMARGLLYTAAFVVVIAGLRAAQELIVPFLLAGFIAVIVAPLLFWLRRRGLPNWAALSVALLGVVVIGALLSAVLSRSIHDFAGELPAYQDRVSAVYGDLLRTLDRHGIGGLDRDVTEALDPRAAIGFVGGLFNSLGGVLANAFLILLTVLFLLAEATVMEAKVRAVANDPDATMAQFGAVFAEINRYIAIKTLTSLGTGLAVALMLAILGIDYAVLWGLLAFLLNYVPNIGSVIAAVPALLLALVQLGMPATVIAAIGYLVINVVVGNVVEPKFMGRRLGLSALVVFLSLVFWGWVLGPVGMFLSVPLTITLKIAMNANPGTRWAAVALGGEQDVAAANRLRDPID